MNCLSLKWRFIDHCCYRWFNYPANVNQRRDIWRMPPHATDVVMLSLSLALAYVKQWLIQLWHECQWRRALIITSAGLRQTTNFSMTARVSLIVKYAWEFGLWPPMAQGLRYHQHRPTPKSDFSNSGVALHWLWSMWENMNCCGAIIIAGAGPCQTTTFPTTARDWENSSSHNSGTSNFITRNHFSYLHFAAKISNLSLFLPPSSITRNLTDF